MAANRRSRRSARRRAGHVVPIFSENSGTDGRALQALAHGIVGGGARIADVVDGEAGRADVAAVLVHRDADGPDPHGHVKRELDAMIRDRFAAPGYGVVPVQEMEAWWLAYPEALGRARAGWRGLVFTGNPEAQANPKEHLQQLTRRKSPKGKYRESDGPEIAKAIVDLACLKDESRAPASLVRFLTDLRAIAVLCH